MLSHVYPPAYVILKGGNFLLNVLVIGSLTVGTFAANSSGDTAAANAQTHSTGALPPVIQSDVVAEGSGKTPVNGAAGGVYR